MYIVIHRISLILSTAFNISTSYHSTVTRQQLGLRSLRLQVCIQYAPSHQNEVSSQTFRLG